MNRHVLTVICIATILFPINGQCNDVFLLAVSGDIVEYDAGNGEVRVLGEDRERGAYRYWPCHDKKRNTVYFESNAEICSMDRDRSNPSVSKILKGLCPAISADSNLLSFWLAPGNIHIMDIKSRKTWLVGAGAANMPAVWISDRKLVYHTADLHIKVIDAVSGQISGHWPDKVIPMALSPDGKAVLCNADNFSSIVLYNTDGKYIDTIKKFESFNSGVGLLIWSSDGKSFICEHKTWWGFSPGFDSYNAYMYDIDTRKETLLMRHVAIFGGVSIGPSKTSITKNASDSETPRPVPSRNLSYQPAIISAPPDKISFPLRTESFPPGDTDDQLKWARTHD